MIKVTYVWSCGLCGEHIATDSYRARNLAHVLPVPSQPPNAHRIKDDVICDACSEPIEAAIVERRQHLERKRREAGHH
jgi:formylmethanofuran dehydrogenase subunit E